jgi:[acyl-carrier-protein] S-malonyltransferase
MQDSVPVGTGGMLAVIGLTPDEVLTLCKWAEEQTGLKPLEPANYNSPDQIVISGNAEIIEWLRTNFSLEKLGWHKKVRLIPLKVSAPFHCSMMKVAEEKMADELAQVKFLDAKNPIVQNFTSQTHSQAEELRRNITLQISGAVRWLQSVELLLQMGSNHFIECGCGKVLTGLLKKIDTTGAQAFNINSLEELKTIERLGDL